MASRMNDTEARKKQILDIATELFALKGYHGVGIDEIADACGVVRGTVLNYFGSKQELYKRVLYDRRNPVKDCMNAVCDDTSISAIEALNKLIEVTAKQFKENIKYIGKDLKSEEFLQNFDVLRLPVYRDQQKYLEKIIERGNKEGVFHIENPRMRAFSIIFAIFGISESLEGEEAMLSEMKEVIKKMLE